MLNIPAYPRRLTMITLVFGIVVFVWLGAEDSVWLVSLFGLGLSVLCAVHGVFRIGGPQGRSIALRLWLPGMVLLGAMIGAGGVLITLLLMVMKTSLHGHLYPDYPFPLISGMVARLPAWTAAGALVGLALALTFYGGRGDG